MTERDALLAAILQNPDDDTPRLVYADWLQEHDEDRRAEFIRLQCRPERPPVALGRELNLIDSLFSHLKYLDFQSVAYHRGFVDTIRSGVLYCRDHIAELRPEDAPAFALELIEDDRDEEEQNDYDAYTDAVRELAARTELRRCVSLTLPCLGMGPGSAILASPNLTSLRRLDFTGNETGPGIHNLARDTFANLRWVNVHNSDSAADCPSITPLAVCPHLANLEHLDFGANEQGDDDLRAVAAAEQWSKLRYLNLMGSLFTLAAVADFFATPHLPALRELDLSHAFNRPAEWNTPGNGDPFVERIATSPLFARLSKLWLQGNGITDDGAKALASAPPGVKLEVLDLTGNPVSDAGRALLRERFGAACVFDGGARD